MILGCWETVLVGFWMSRNLLGLCPLETTSVHLPWCDNQKHLQTSLFIPCYSVTWVCLTLFNPMDCKVSDFPVFHYFPEFTQTRVHWVGDAIQLSHPLPLPSPPAFSLFKRVSSSHQVAKLLELQFQHQSFRWIFRTDFLWDGLVGSPCSSRDSQESSPAPQFASINSLVLSFLYGPTFTFIHDYWKNTA